MDFFKDNKLTIFFVLIIFIYSLIVLTTGYFHEPWADEAQAFIYAKNYSIYELLFEKLSYEGHPIVWYLIIKLLLSIKLISPQVLYENLFIFSCLCNIFAIYLLLFKSKLPLFIKILFPFTFFILYQYPVIARNHSLVLPMLAIIAVNFENRLKHPFIYSILLIILANISAYSFLLSGILFLFFSYDIWKSNKLKIKGYLPLFITGLFLLFTILYLRKPVDSASPAQLNLQFLSILNFLESIRTCYFNYSSGFLRIIQTIIVLSLYILVSKIFCKTKYQLLFFLGCNIPLFLIQTIFYVNDWHHGYAIIFMLFSLWVLTNENTIQESDFKFYSIFRIVFILILLTHIIWSLKCVAFDIKNRYCGSKLVVEYINDKALYNKNIATVGFKTISFFPYLEKNIFYNIDDKDIWVWKQNIIENTIINIEKKSADIIIVPNSMVKRIHFLEKNYTKDKTFCGYLVSKGNIKEDNCFIVYKKQ